MTRHLLFIFLFITGCIVCKANNPSFQEYTTFGGPRYLHYTSDGNIIAIGADTNAVIYKFDSAGHIQWSRRFIPFSLYPNACSITEDAEGNYVVSGTAYQFSPQQNNTFIAKFTPSGSLLYLKKVKYLNFDTKYSSLVAMPDSGFVAAGFGVSSSFLTTRYDKTGNVIWSRSYLLNSGPITHSFSAVPADNYNSLVIAGIKYSTGIHSQLIKIDLSTGIVLWGKLYAFPGTSSVYPGKLVSCNNGYAFSIALNDSLNSTSVILRTDTVGNIIWAKEYAAPYPMSATSLAYLADDGFELAGNLNTNGSQQFFIRTAADGTLIDEFNTGNIMFMPASDEISDIINGPGNTIFGCGYVLMAFNATPYGICQAFYDSITTTNPVCLASNDTGTIYTSVVQLTDQSAEWPVTDGNIVMITTCFFTGIAEAEKKPGFIISPNPANEAFVMLSSPDENVPAIDAVEILDYTGRLIIKSIPENGRLAIPEGPGIYLLSLYSENKLVSVQKLVRVN